MIFFLLALLGCRHKDDPPDTGAPPSSADTIFTTAADNAFSGGAADPSDISTLLDIASRGVIAQGALHACGATVATRLAIWCASSADAAEYSAEPGDLLIQLAPSDDLCDEPTAGQALTFGDAEVSEDGLYAAGLYSSFWNGAYGIVILTAAAPEAFPEVGFYQLQENSSSNIWMDYGEPTLLAYGDFNRSAGTSTGVCGS